MGPTGRQQQETPQLGFNCKKADWPAFARHIQAYTEPILQQLRDLQQPTAQALDGIAEELTEAITRAADASIPRLRTVERSKPWWSTELTSLRQALHRAYRDYKSHQSRLKAQATEGHLRALQEAGKRWKAAKNAYFHAIRTAKTQHWLDFLANAEGTEAFTAYRYTKGAYTSNIQALSYESPSGLKTAHSFEEKCTAFFTTLFPTPLDLRRGLQGDLQGGQQGDLQGDLQSDL